MKDIKYWIWLSSIENLSPKIILQLLKKYKQNLEKIWKLNKEELLKNNINIKDIEKILNNKYRNKEKIEKYIYEINKNKIEVINIFDKYYPKSLKNIYDPPIVLYIKGNKKILNNKSVAIIGCRNCSIYGQNAAKYFGYNLSKYNINIISGMAKGIDSFAHIGAINANKKTIAVVGTGLDIVYPKENKKIQEQILKTGGAIISEYLPGTKPEKRNFPARNRIISGISNIIIVVEAKEKSGTLITVDFALEQGKDVYVIPR